MCLAIPGQVSSIYEKEGMRFAAVSFAGMTREVCLHCVPEVERDDFVLVHVGLAIAKIDRAEADRAWELLRQLGQDAEVFEGEAP
jgi:hydrogenase expression/formation protein HypC